MAVPTYDLFIEPLLRILVQYADGLPARQGSMPFRVELDFTGDAA